MKRRKPHSLAYLFAFVFVLINVLLHKNEGPLNPCHSAAATAFRLAHHQLEKDISQTALHDKDNAPTIGKEKLRTRYKGSEVKFIIPFSPVCFVKAACETGTYTLPDFSLIPFRLHLVSAQRGPPAV